MKQWQQWTNDQCTLCKDSSHPEMATHLFNCTALTQPALQEDAVQLVQECLYCLQDQTLVALSLLTDISKYLLALPAGYLWSYRHLRHNRQLEWNGQHEGWSASIGINSRGMTPISPSQPEAGPKSSLNSSGRWCGNFGRQEMMQYITQASSHSPWINMILVGQKWQKNFSKAYYISYLKKSTTTGCKVPCWNYFKKI